MNFKGENEFKLSLSVIKIQEGNLHFGLELMKWNSFFAAIFAAIFRLISVHKFLNTTTFHFSIVVIILTLDFTIPNNKANNNINESHIPLSPTSIISYILIEILFFFLLRFLMSSKTESKIID